MEIVPHNIIAKLQSNFEGELFNDRSSLLQYATDASAYREVPLLIARPKHKEDIRELIYFARKHKLPITPRTAGTSLAGQVVGNGIIADVSRHMNAILEVNAKEKWVRLEPGVVLDELNLEIKKHGLFFGPETSTSNRCMIGGMVGNNACGAHSLIYGSTRDHTLAIKALLSDGSEVEFKAIDKEEFQRKARLETLEGELYRNIDKILSDEGNRKSITAEFPDPEIKRRNTGYAIDLLLNTAPFSDEEKEFNFSGLIAGSEGTLAFITEITLNLLPLPPKEKAVMAMHCNDLKEAFHANLIALKYQPGAIELMDSKVLELTKENHTQKKNRFFVEGEPAAILIIEFARSSRDEILQITSRMEIEMRDSGYGYHYPLIFGEDISKVWALRKAGLGVLSNIPGDAKPLAVIEDTAVRPQDLPKYMEDIASLLDKYKLECIYHAHIGTGELHLRPVLNLKDKDDVKLFRKIAHDTAILVKKYNGSLSGEHGDGRLRGMFIQLMIGDKNYELLRSIKKTWDPDNLFNPGKIIDTPEMNTSLRYMPGKESNEIETYFDFSGEQGILRATEKCTGTGDCRKTELIGGTMCPSFMATREEKDSTRARANILREFLTNSENKNPFDHKEIFEVMDLCLSCKACKSECPSSVDITKYKAEFLQQYYDANGVPLRSRIIANIASINKAGMLLPGIYNFMISNRLISGILKKLLGFASQRSIPRLYSTTLKRWARRNPGSLSAGDKKVYLLADEFTNYNDVEVGIAAIKLLTTLGYKVEIPGHVFSGRTYLSKGLLKKAKELALKNVTLLSGKINDDAPLVGIEPSAIFCFRDEYLELLDDDMRDAAFDLSKNCYTIDEFIASEFIKGNINQNLFTTDHQKIVLHGHCYQKALASVTPSIDMLCIPSNYEVEEINSGCCGMAGAFGYEKEHYELSMKVGEIVLLPAIREADNDVIIAAPGTSCRHQIKDGGGKKALHPVEILYKALI